MTPSPAIDPRIRNLKSTTFLGKRLTRRQIADIQETVGRFPQLSRAELGHTICEHLGWHAPNGNNSVQLALRVLETLEQLEILTLPPKRHRGRGPQRPVGTAARSDPQPPVAEPLAALRPLRLELAESPETVAEWNEWVQRHHYLGYRQPFGAHLRYFLRDCQGRLLGCLLFDFAARDLACRDRRIGWQSQAHRKHLRLVVRNSRFLLLPWVQVKNLASHALGLALRQLPGDWQRKHGYRPALVESYVDPERHRGTCYQASNWERVGQTRGRKAKGDQPAKSPKDVYIHPLRPDWQRVLAGGPAGVSRPRPAQPQPRPQPDERFIALWQEIMAAVVQVAHEHDAAWMQRQRVLSTLLVVLFVFRLVFAPNRQGYALTLRDLWAQCRALDIPLPKPEPVSQSSMHAARCKVHDAVFFRIHREILRRAPPDEPRTLWYGHRTFAVDGSKLNLPQPLLENGYRRPSDGAHYPQGLLSCLFRLRSRLPVDFELELPRRRAPPGPGPLARPRPLRCRQSTTAATTASACCTPTSTAACTPSSASSPTPTRSASSSAAPAAATASSPSRPPTRPASNSPRPAGGPAASAWSATPPATPTTCSPPPCSTAAATPSAPSRTSTMRAGAWKNCTSAHSTALLGSRSWVVGLSGC